MSKEQQFVSQFRGGIRFDYWKFEMLDVLPIEIVVRIGELGKWNKRTFLALSQVSKNYRNTVQALRPFAERFDLDYDGPGNGKADMAPPETIAELCFINWKTNNPQVARRLSSIAFCLTFNGSGRRTTNENMLDLESVRNLSLLIAMGSRTCRPWEESTLSAFGIAMGSWTCRP